MMTFTKRFVDATNFFKAAHLIYRSTSKIDAKQTQQASCYLSLANYYVLKMEVISRLNDKTMNKSWIKAIESVKLL